MRRGKKFLVAASITTASLVPLVSTSQPVSAHMTCANMLHGHPVGIAWWANKVGSGFYTYYDWYAGNGPGVVVYQGRIQCPYA